MDVPTNPQSFSTLWARQQELPWQLSSSSSESEATIQQWLDFDRLLAAAQRSNLDSDELDRLKYATLHRREAHTRLLLSDAEIRPDFRVLALQQLARRLSKQEIQGLEKVGLHRDQLGELAAHFGYPDLAKRLLPNDSLAHRRAGPDLALPFEAGKPSKWPFDRWQKQQACYHYDWHGEELEYRGLRLRSGDMFLVHLSEPTAGIYTCYLQPPQSFAHYSVLVFLDGEYGRTPAVLELHRMGLRTVPLHSYFSREMVEYLEVYRLPISEQPKDWASKLNEAAKQALREPHPYGFDPVKNLDKGLFGLTCTQIGDLLLERTGVKRWREISCPTPKGGDNLRVLGLDIGHHLTPGDYLYGAPHPGAELRYVGCVDNGAAVDLLVRYFVTRCIGEYFSTRELLLDRLGLEFKLNRWAIDQYQRGTPLGKLVIGLFGFTEATFPDGPKEFLAAIDILERAILKLRHGATPVLTQSIDFEKTHDISRWRSNKALRNQVDKSATAFLRFFT